MEKKTKTEFRDAFIRLHSKNIQHLNLSAFGKMHGQCIGTETLNIFSIAMAWSVVWLGKYSVYGQIAETEMHRYFLVCYCCCWYKVQHSGGIMEI